MAPPILPDSIPLAGWLNTLLPDFVLAFAFFTALSYAALGRRFLLQRPAITMSAVMGLALAIGLVCWEQAHGLSLRNLGPIAVGFALVVLATVVYQAVRRTGGSWAGAGIALGVCVLIGLFLGVNWPIGAEAVQGTVVLALLFGIMAFLIHHRRAPGFVRQPMRYLPAVRRDRREIRQARRVGHRLKDGLHHARQDTQAAFLQPARAKDVMLQLERMLPAEGWLTERMAKLRERAHCMRKGHVARIEELREVYPKLSVPAQRKLAQELAARYQELEIDVRVERLDKAVAENERRIRDLTRQAQRYLQAHEPRKVVDVLERASKLQKHNDRLFKIIDHTEARLIRVARQAATQSSGVSDE